MPNERVILCGDAAPGNTLYPDPNPIRLAWTVDGNVRVRIEDIRKPMWRDVPNQFQDLIDIATYVYCADQAVTRGGDGVDNLGEDWRRRLFFHIPVRDPALWSDAKMREELASTLSFLSEDEYHFEFVNLKERRSFQTYFNFANDQPLGGKIEEVMLFSGGLDSVAGVVQEVITDKKQIVLVNHRSSDKLVTRQRDLLSKLRAHAGHVPIEFIPVHINKDKGLGREYTQRSRSFLYAALAATIAQMLDLNRIRFYENGVVSLNLPLAAQVVGARATRTTHPQVLNGFERLFSALAGRAFTVENPFLWKTKNEVVKQIVDAGCSDVIEHTTSCTHTWEITLEHPHCGVCSQCIDRRFATLGGGAADADPASGYEVDLLTGARDKSVDRTMLAAYVETASEIADIDAAGFFSRYGEASRVLRHIPGTSDAIAAKVFELHQRHAKQVGKVVDDALRQYPTAIRRRTLPATCLLKLVCETGSDIVVETRPASVSAAKEASAVAADNSFKQRAAHWVIRYAGSEEKIYDPHKGFAYLQILIASPGKPFSVTDLACRVAREPNKYMLGSAGEVTDAEALEAYRGRYEELKQSLAEAESAKANMPAASNEEVSRIKDEMAKLLEEIKKDRGLGKRMRKAGDDRNRVRDRVCAAIRRALKEITKWDKRLAEHLKQPTLRQGYEVVYDPREDKAWDM